MLINFKIKNNHCIEELQKAVNNDNIRNSRHSSLQSEETDHTHALKSSDKSDGSILIL